MKSTISILALFALSMTSCNDNANIKNVTTSEVDSLKLRIQELESEIENNQLNLARFDSVDFEAWNKKDIELFNRLHDENVVMYYPDRKIEKGLKAHTDWANHSFTTGEGFVRVKSHPIKVASNDWTAVIGINEIPQKDGTIKEAPMATFSKWSNGKMIEEHLFFETID